MIVVVPVDPPRDGLVLQSIAEETPLSDSDARLLYEAAVADVFRVVASSGGDLLVNYRDEETLPEGVAAGEADAEAEVRALAADALGGTDDVRFERQVGSTRAARVGNTVTHLLEREDAQSVGVIEPTAALVARTEIDGAAMSLRRHDVVLGPAPGGRTYFAGFAEPIDFEDVYAPPELATIADRAAAADLGIGFAPMVPTVETPADLVSTIAGIRARKHSQRPGAPTTEAAIDHLGIEVREVDGEAAIVSQ